MELNASSSSLPLRVDSVIDQPMKDSRCICPAANNYVWVVEEELPVKERLVFGCRRGELSGIRGVPAR